jgi:hypothetical protein
MSSFEKDLSQYDRSVETLTPQDVFEEVLDPGGEMGPLPVQTQALA